MQSFLRGTKDPRAIVATVATVVLLLSIYAAIKAVGLDNPATPSLVSLLIGVAVAGISVVSLGPPSKGSVRAYAVIVALGLVVLGLMGALAQDAMVFLTNGLAVAGGAFATLLLWWLISWRR